MIGARFLNRFRKAWKSAWTDDRMWQTGANPLGLANLAFMPRTKVDYAREVGDGLSSSVLMEPVKWIQRNFPEAKLEVIERSKDQEKPQANHPLTELLRRPNEFYSEAALWSGTIFSWIVSGDAYWIKIRNDVGRQGRNWYENVTGEPKQLWYAPHWLMTPRSPSDGSAFISYYEFNTGRALLKIPTENVIHFRNGIDPRDSRHGMSQIGSVVREIFSDDEAGNWVASLLKNMAVPGLVISPKSLGNEPGAKVIANTDGVKEWFKNMFTGDKRGEPLVMKGPTDVQEFGFDPKTMDLAEIRNTPEERVCAALGIPASVVGFGTGLQQTKVGATMFEQIRLAWTGCLIPLQCAMASQLDFSLLPEFEDDTKKFSVRFNHKEVAAMQENRKMTAQAMDIAVRGGWALVAEGREAMGWEVRPEDRVYLRPANTVEVREGTVRPEPQPQPAQNNLQLPSDRVPPDGKAKLWRHAPYLGNSKATSQQNALQQRFLRNAIDDERAMETDVTALLNRMGGQLARLAMEVFEPKARIEDELAVDAIMADFDVQSIRERFGEIAAFHYMRIATNTYRAIEQVMGLAVDLPDFRAREIVVEGGRHMGLIDLTDSVRSRLFRELAEGRSLGEGPVELARRIREMVPAGTWGSVETRARVIARTETLHAQRFSALMAYQDAPNVSGVLIFDARLGNSDEHCEARNGRVVSVDEAAGMMDDEHPNGTLSFSPVIA